MEGRLRRRGTTAVQNIGKHCGRGAKQPMMLAPMAGRDAVVVVIVRVVDDTDHGVGADRGDVVGHGVGLS